MTYELFYLVSSILSILFLLLFLLIIVIFPTLYIYRAYKVICSNSQYNISTDHTAIIVIEYSGKYWYKNIFVYLSGIELLTEGLKELRVPYVLYRCSNPHQFMEIINTETARRIWIIGHGRKHGVSFGNEMLYYCEVGDNYKKTGLPPKEYVRQLHCNPYGGKSLIDYICDKNDLSFVTDDDRIWWQNRKYIKDTLKTMKKEKP